MLTSSQGASGPGARTGLHSGPVQQVSGNHATHGPVLTPSGQTSSEPRNDQIRNLIVRLLINPFNIRIDETPGDTRPLLKGF
jgi:hypothetical protein